MADLSAVLGEVLLGLGAMWRCGQKQYTPYRWLRNVACVPPAQQTKVLVYVRLHSKEVDLVPDFTRDVTEVGHHGTGDLEVQLRTERELERARDLFVLGYAAA
ncbi:hypothetical protein ABZ348_03080 [Streptomyces sp. NPDC005963]|uniref:hypothetical protein n=1 Tax=Streptomyces sp. NPDC005963 TaxID=3156721 RepID=UPI0033E81187